MIETVGRVLLVLILVACAAETNGGEETERPRGSQLFFRAVSGASNAPIEPKTRSAWTQDRRASTGNTGMADEGFTEYPFCYGRMDFTFVERNAYFPRFISGARADETIVNTADMVLDHVYEPDGCVWGLRGREMVQTFTATGPELVSVTLLVASEPGHFRMELLEGGPGGAQVGPSKRFWSGHSLVWGHVRWPAGQAPLAAGRTYGLRIRREDGAAWMPYLHSTGDAYDGGLLVVDGRPRPESDLAARIVEESDEVRRGLVLGADADGWVYGETAVEFIPRTPNVRMLDVTISPVPGRAVDLVVWVWESRPSIRAWDVSGRVVAGPKRGLASGPPGGQRSAPILFATDELPVIPGRRYSVWVATAPHHGPLPTGGPIRQQRDVRLRVYGEVEPGKLPAIFNLEAASREPGRLDLSWSEPFPCPTRIVAREVSPSGREVDVTAPSGEARARLPALAPGAEVDVRLESTGPTGQTWRTPLYRLRLAGPDAEAALRASAPYPSAFLPLAPPVRSRAPELGPLRYREELPVANASFESGLDGWEVTSVRGSEELRSWLESADLPGPAAAPRVSAYVGTHAAGFTHAAGERREQVFTDTLLHRQVATRPGHEYVLSAAVRTSVVRGPRGDTRVRFVAGGPDAATDPDAATQWYWTDGRWMRMRHRWVATSDRSTIGFGFFRWRDLDRASARVDDVRVFDLGPAPLAPDDPPGREATGPFGMHRQEPGRVLVDRGVRGERPAGGVGIEAPPGHVVTGIGWGRRAGRVVTVRIAVRALRPDGALGPRELLRGGPEPDGPLEIFRDLPAGHVATGLGLAPATGASRPRLAIVGRSLGGDGALGDEVLLGDLEPGDSVFRAEGRLVLVGVRIAEGADAASFVSAVVLPTATARGVPEDPDAPGVDQ